MSRIARRLGFLMMVLFTLTTLTSAVAHANAEGSEDTERVVDTTSEAETAAPDLATTPVPTLSSDAKCTAAPTLPPTRSGTTWAPW